MQHLRIATQNIQWGGDPLPDSDGTSRLHRLVPQMASLEADLLILTEFKGGERGALLLDLLTDAGYASVVHGEPPDWKLGTAIASRVPVTEIALPIIATLEEWRSVAVRVLDVTVVGLYFPLNEAKRPFWKWVLANAAELRDRDVLLVGDFNTGKQGIDEAGFTLSSSDCQEALEALGYVDCWRSAHPDGRDYTWYSSAGNGFRLDYMWASPSFAPRVVSVAHNHDARVSSLTDHAAVVADIGFPRPTVLHAHNMREL